MLGKLMVFNLALINQLSVLLDVSSETRTTSLASVSNLLFNKRLEQFNKKPFVYDGGVNDVQYCIDTGPFHHELVLTKDQLFELERVELCSSLSQSYLEV